MANKDTRQTLLCITFIATTIILEMLNPTDGYSLASEIRKPEGGVFDMLVNAPIQKLCKDDENWNDSSYGDGSTKCADMKYDWCQNFGDYSTEAKRGCPKTCGVCEDMVCHVPFAAYSAFFAAVNCESVLDESQLLGVRTPGVKTYFKNGEISSLRCTSYASQCRASIKQVAYLYENSFNVEVCQKNDPLYKLITELARTC